jgi:hypothetical protein
MLALLDTMYFTQKPKVCDTLRRDKERYSTMKIDEEGMNLN